MTHFIYDDGPLPYPKTDNEALPSGADATKYVSAVDWNQMAQALADAKDAMRAGKWNGLEPQSSDPAPAGVGVYLWVDLGGQLHVNGQSLAADFVSVKSYGAVGDGVTDDRVAIQAAINAAVASGGRLHFPPGTYMVSKGAGVPCLVVSGKTDLVITGVKGQSVIKQKTNVASAIDSACPLFQISNTQRVAIRDLTFDGNWGNAQTTVASGSDGATLPQATINVASTTGFPSSGTFYIILPTGRQAITYSGKTATTFTGCSGGTAVLKGNGDLGRIGYAVGYYEVGHAHVTAPSDGHTLPQSTIDVNDTSTFPTAGQIRIGSSTIAYSGKTSTTFTGCTGGSGTISTNDSVWDPNGGLNQYGQRDPKSYLLWLYGTGGDVADVEISGCTFQQAFGDGVWIGGDGTGGAQSGHIGGTRDVKIINCTFNMCARNGITLSYAKGVRIEKCTFTNIFTTAIDTEPVEVQVADVVIEDCDLGLWWNPFHDSLLNSLSISGGEVGAPSEWNFARSYRVRNNRIQGCVFISDAIDIKLEGNTIMCDLDTVSGAPICVEMFVDDLWITGNKIYARNGAASALNYGAINLTRYTVDSNSAMQPAGVHITDNTVHVRGGMDGIYVDASGGNNGYSGTASDVTATTLTDSGASWATNQFVGHTVVMGGKCGVVTSNTGTVLTLSTWHLDGSHGWVDARGEYVSTPSTGVYVIQPTGGVVDIVDNTIDCVASDGRSAGRYGVHVTTTSTFSAYYADMRVRVRGNKIRGANDRAVNVFVYDTAAPIAYVNVSDNFFLDDQPTPTCIYGVYFDCNSGTFDPNAQITKLVIRNNSTEGVREPDGGLTQGYWLEEDGTAPKWLGYGSPVSTLAAPVGSLFRRLDGGTNTTTYVKEDGGTAINTSAGSGSTTVAVATDTTRNLDAVTTTIDKCLIVCMMTAEPGSGNSNWDQATNGNLAGFTEILQATSVGDIWAAAGVNNVAGSTGTGTVRQHAASSEFGPANITVALTPQVPGVAPTWVANGTTTATTTGNITPPWPTHLKDDYALLIVETLEGDTPSLSDAQGFTQISSSPQVGTFAAGGSRLTVWERRAYKPGMTAPTVTHSGAHILGAIMLFRGCTNGSKTGWAAK